MAINVPPNVPPPLGQRAPGTDHITSDHTGGPLDLVREAIMALQLFAERAKSDDITLAKIHKVIVGLQSILADHASDHEAAMGLTPAMRHLRRTTQGY